MDEQTPLDEGMQQPASDNMPVEIEILEYWSETIPWIMGIATMLAFYFLWTFRNVMVYSGLMLSGNLEETAGYWFGFIGMAAPCIYMTYSLYRFAVLLRQATQNRDQYAATQAFRPLRHFFIILLCLSLVSIAALAAGPALELLGNLAGEPNQL